MAIKYVNVINSFVSTEGSNGIMTNYIYYSLLVVNTDGSSQIVEGRLNQISYLMPFIRTPVDEIQELKVAVKELHKEINNTVDQKMTCILDSLYPIPPIQDLNEVDALKRLDQAGLKPILVPNYPEGTPKNGIVRASQRNDKNFKEVFLYIIHPVPDVIGLQVNEALEKLQVAGFTAEITRIIRADIQDGVVLNCNRPDNEKLHVSLEVCKTVPETKGMSTQEACEILQQAGFTVTTIKQSNSSITPNTVIHWSSTSDSHIQLFISVPPSYKAQEVNVKPLNQEKDFSDDSYTAQAVFDNDKKTLLIKLSYTLVGKAKRQITGIRCNVGNHTIPDRWVIEPKELIPLSINIPFDREFEALPETIHLEMDIQYGLMKKSTIPLDITFKW